MSVRGWVKDGAKANDPPPLDDPREMASWWARVKKNKVPNGILSPNIPGPPDLNKLPKPKKEQAKKAQAKVEESFLTVEPPPAKPIFEEVGKTPFNPEDALDRLRHRVAQMHKALDNTMTPSAPGRELDLGKVTLVGQECRAWEEQLRREEKDRDDRLAKQKKLVLAADVQKDVGALISRLRQALETNLERAADQGKLNDQQRGFFNEALRKSFAVMAGGGNVV